jgi:uncharacterized membrane protein YdbT with pleckstrin-like domain
VSDDENLRALLRHDLDASAAASDPMAVVIAVKADRHRRKFSRGLRASIAIVSTVAALALLYVLAAQVLPAPAELGAALFWAPIVVIAVLICCAAWFVVSIVLDDRR